MEIDELIAYAQTMAIRNRLLPDAAALYRKFCRTYSKKFHTPLPEVEKLDAITVLQAVYEEQLESLDLDDEDHVTQILERIMSIEDPTYEAANEEDLQDFMEEAEAEEELRMEKKIPLSKALAPKKKEAPSLAQKQKELPKEGGINLAYLAESENEG